MKDCSAWIDHGFSTTAVESDAFEALSLYAWCIMLCASYGPTITYTTTTMLILHVNYLLLKIQRFAGSSSTIDKQIISAACSIFPKSCPSCPQVDHWSTWVWQFRLNRNILSWLKTHQTWTIVAGNLNLNYQWSDIWAKLSTAIRIEQEPFWKSAGHISLKFAH